MLLNGVETTSSLCKTASGIAVGDEKSAILPAYEDNPDQYGPGMGVRKRQHLGNE